MRYQLVIVGVSCVLGVGACKKDEASKPATAKTDEKPDEKPATPAASGCSATAWKEPSGLFCIDAPPGFKAEVEKTEEFGADDPTMTATFAKAQGAGEHDITFHVSW